MFSFAKKEKLVPIFDIKGNPFEVKDNVLRILLGIKNFVLIFSLC